MASNVGGRQKTTLFMGIGESKGSKETEKTRSEGKKQAPREKEKK
ncbi:MAG: hypothetical protein RMI56_05370 [Sulfolobales archaeon]|nr:hypothetical protein [Sulfolobales archaeon]MDW8083210.1 hypothetical protein [Sulfolobales archaeon]